MSSLLTFLLHPPPLPFHTQLIRGCLASDDSSLGEAASRVVEAIILKGMEPNGSVCAKLAFIVHLANILSPFSPSSTFNTPDKCEMLTRLGLVGMLTQPLHIAAEAADVDRLLQLARTTNALVTVMVADMQRYAPP